MLGVFLFLVYGFETVGIVYHVLRMAARMARTLGELYARGVLLAQSSCSSSSSAWKLLATA